MELKEIRRTLGMTQKELAERTGIPFRTIQDLEADKVMHVRTTRADYVYRLAKVLNVEMEELVNMNEYVVLQGAMTSSGNGDLNKVGRFFSLDEAMECFNRVKDDKDGWTGNPAYVETMVICDDDYENPIAYESVDL